MERATEIAPFKNLHTVVILAAVALPPAEMRRIERICKESAQPILFILDNAVVGAYGTAAIATPADAIEQFTELGVQDIAVVQVHGTNVQRLWQLPDMILQGAEWDAELVEDLIDPTAQVHLTTLINDADGSVIIGPNVTVHPYCVLSGPLTIGENTTILSGTVLSHSSIGPTCKIAGEVTHSIFQGWSNKAHYGFVGHSVFGEWCNLGAGTTTSNLKNTYGTISTSMPDGIVNTGLQFLGTLSGDYTKTAIGAMLQTGTVIGNMVAINHPSHLPTSIPSFTWLTDNTLDKYDLAKAQDHAGRTMNRRGKTLSASTRALFTAIIGQSGE